MFEIGKADVEDLAIDTKSRSHKSQNFLGDFRGFLGDARGEGLLLG